MPDVEFTNLLAVTVIALLAPLTLGLSPGLRLPAVVLEIIAGVVVGPQALGWVEVDLPVSIVALLGLAFLLFLAGLEIDVHRLRGRVLRLAVLGYLVTVALGVAAGVALDAAGWVDSPGLVAITLSATSLGLVVPVLKDAGQVDTGLGQAVVAAASVADFVAIVLLSLLFSGSDAGTGSRLVLLVSFAALVATTAVVISYVARSRRLDMTLTRLQDTTAQIRVRAAVVLLVAFVALAERFGLESILGAFHGRRRGGAARQGLPGAPELPGEARGDRLRLPHPGVLRDQWAPARPERPPGEPVGPRPGPDLRARAAGRPRTTGHALRSAVRPSLGGRGRPAPGDVVAVHRHRDPDRRPDRPHERRHRSGAGLRWSPVGDAVPGCCPRPAPGPAGRPAPAREATSDPVTPDRRPDVAGATVRTPSIGTNTERGRTVAGYGRRCPDPALTLAVAACAQPGRGAHGNAHAVVVRGRADRRARQCVEVAGIRSPAPVRARARAPERQRRAGRQ
ncbi:cation:proton antiporter [Nocardioides panacis]|uniref:Cation:proton antiporter n=1 Tax=Nocardioides panacis TaxID=2849501 RepID=A0A975T3U8_9ACTN|nr:cation:proton antiporter [Nocardioides panacis]